ncbi:MAG: hypothetical protein HWD60_10445 [Defluviicoccus sp.]|nr:MAG: hypothetical protein HWD60_10445 [Defluviicoccus sp.]
MRIERFITPEDRERDREPFQFIAATGERFFHQIVEEFLPLRICRKRRACLDAVELIAGFGLSRLNLMARASVSPPLPFPSRWLAYVATINHDSA